MAPEMLLHKRYFGEAVDVWSLGVILYTLLFGEMPFEEDGDNETKMKILTEEPRYPDPEIIGPPLSLVQSMLSKDPRTRPSLADILNNPWLDKHGAAQREILNEKEPKPFSTRAEKRLLRTFRAAHFDMDRLAESVLLAKCDPMAGLWALSVRREMKIESKRSHRSSISISKYSMSRKNSNTSTKEKAPLLRALGKRSGSGSRTTSLLLPSSPISPKHKTSSWVDETRMLPTNPVPPVIEVSHAPVTSTADRCPERPQRSLSKSKSAGVLGSARFDKNSIPQKYGPIVSPAKSMNVVSTEKKRHLVAFKNVFMKFVMPSHSKKKIKPKKSSGSSLLSGIVDNLSKHSSSDKEKEKDTAHNTASNKSTHSGSLTLPGATQTEKSKLVGEETPTNTQKSHSNESHAANDSFNSAYGTNINEFKYTSSPRQSDDLGRRSSVENSDLLMTPTLRESRPRPISQISQFSQISGFSQISALSQFSSATSQISQDQSASELSVNGNGNGSSSRSHPLRRPHLGRRSTSSSISSLHSNRGRRKHNKSHSKASSTSSASVQSRSPSRHRVGVESPDSGTQPENGGTLTKSKRTSRSKPSDLFFRSQSSTSVSNRYNIGTSFPRMFSSTSGSGDNATDSRSSPFTKRSPSSSGMLPTAGGINGNSNTANVLGGSWFNESAVFGSKGKPHRRRLMSASTRSYSPRSGGAASFSSSRKGLHHSLSGRSRKKETPIEEEAETDEEEEVVAKNDGAAASGELNGNSEPHVNGGTNGSANLEEEGEEDDDDEEEEETVHLDSIGYEEDEDEEDDDFTETGKQKTFQR